ERALYAVSSATPNQVRPSAIILSDSSSRRRSQPQLTYSGRQFKLTSADRARPFVARGRMNSWEGDRVTKDLLAYLRPHRWILVAGGVLGLIGSAAGLAMPLLAKYVVDAFGEGGSMAGPLLGLTVAVLIGALVSAFGSYLMERTGEGVVMGARRRLVDRILRLRVADVDRLKPGDLLSRVTSDTTLLRSVLTNGVVDSVSSVFMLVG